MPRTSLMQVENVRRGLAAASGARVELRTTVAVTSLAESVGARCVVNSAGARIGLVASDATIPYAAPQPRLLSCHLEAVTGSTHFNASLSVWSHLGKIRYSVRDESTLMRLGITTYSPTVADLSYSLVKSGSGLVVGQVYTLWYWLDCIPDVAGYTEEWRICSPEWTQPSSIEQEDSFVYDFRQP